MYDKLHLYDNAALTFTEYCLKEVDIKASNFEEQMDLYYGFQYLANYHLQKGSLEDAYTFAFKCLEHAEVRYTRVNQFCGLKSDYELLSD